MQNHPQLLIRHFCASRYQAQAQVFGIQRYVEQDQAHFTPQQHSALVAFLRHMDWIIKAVDNAEATKQLSTISIEILLCIYSYWTEDNLLPQDGPVTRLPKIRLHGLTTQIRGWLTVHDPTPKCIPWAIRPILADLHRSDRIEGT